MNKIIIMGRLTRDPEIRYTAGDDPLTIASFSLAVDRKFKSENSTTNADFFNCRAFGKQADFVEKYLRQGTKVLTTGRIQNDNYTNKNGEKVYSFQVMVEEIEFAESKKAAETAPEQPANDDGFMNIPDGIDEELPFNQEEKHGRKTNVC